MTLKGHMNTKHIWTDPGRMSGKPCLRGQRVTVSQLLATLAEGETVGQFAADFDLPLELVVGALEDLAIWLVRDRPE